MVVGLRRGYLVICCIVYGTEKATKVWNWTVDTKINMEKGQVIGV